MQPPDASPDFAGPIFRGFTPAPPNPEAPAQPPPPGAPGGGIPILQFTNPVLAMQHHCLVETFRLPVRGSGVATLQRPPDALGHPSDDVRAVGFTIATHPDATERLEEIAAAAHSGEFGLRLEVYRYHFSPVEMGDGTVLAMEGHFHVTWWMRMDFKAHRLLGGAVLDVCAQCPHERTMLDHLAERGHLALVPEQELGAATPGGGHLITHEMDLVVMEVDTEQLRDALAVIDTALMVEAK